MGDKDLKPLQFIPFYLLWIISSALSLLDWALIRAAVTSLATVIAAAIPTDLQLRRQWSARWALRAVDPCTVAVLTVLVLASIISFDYLYRDGLIRGTIKRRFGIVTTVQASLLIVAGIIVTVSSFLAR